jgi:hypothetical protein
MARQEEMMANRTKSVDLGTIQDNLIAAKRKLVIDERALERAHQAYDVSKEEYSKAVQELKDATRTVLG